MPNQVVLFVDEKSNVIQCLRNEGHERPMLFNEIRQQATDWMTLNAVERDSYPVSEMFLAATGTTKHIPVWIAAWDKMRERNLQNG